MKRYQLRNIPAATDWRGRLYPAHVDLVLICSRGLRWDGGEYATREQAIAAGERKIGLARLADPQP